MQLLGVKLVAAFMVTASAMHGRPQGGPCSATQTQVQQAVQSTLHLVLQLQDPQQAPSAGNSVEDAWNRVWAQLLEQCNRQMNADWQRRLLEMLQSESFSSEDELNDVVSCMVLQKVIQILQAIIEQHPQAVRDRGGRLLRQIEARLAAQETGTAAPDQSSGTGSCSHTPHHAGGSGQSASPHGGGSGQSSSPDPATSDQHAGGGRPSQSECEFSGAGHVLGGDWSNKDRYSRS